MSQPRNLIRHVRVAHQHIRVEGHRPAPKHIHTTIDTATTTQRAAVAGPTFGATQHTSARRTSARERTPRPPHPAHQHSCPPPRAPAARDGGPAATAAARPGWARAARGSCLEAGPCRARPVACEPQTAPAAGPVVPGIVRRLDWCRVSVVRVEQSVYGVVASPMASSNNRIACIRMERVHYQHAGVRPHGAWRRPPRVLTHPRCDVAPALGGLVSDRVELICAPKTGHDRPSCAHSKQRMKHDLLSWRTVDRGRGGRSRAKATVQVYAPCGVRRTSIA